MSTEQRQRDIVWLSYDMTTHDARYQYGSVDNVSFYQIQRGEGRENNNYHFPQNF